MAGVAVVPRRQTEDHKPADDLTSMRAFRRDVVLLRRMATYLGVRTSGEALNRFLAECGPAYMAKLEREDKKDH
jgi:hypothetical protein